ncbi:hypothetical protein Efla_005003 [Eimeria flavescens]
MEGPTQPPGDGLQAAAGLSALPRAAVGFGPASADSISSMGLAADALQRAARGPQPAMGEVYTQAPPAFMMNGAMPQQPISPVGGMEFTQVAKLPDGISPTHMGMLSFLGVAKTPPKALPARQTPEGALTPEGRVARVEEMPQGRPPLTPPASCEGMLAAPGGLSVRRGGGSGNSSTVSSGASNLAGPCPPPARSSGSTVASRSTAGRKVTTPVSRPAPTPGIALVGNSFHTEYREQMSPSWWLGAAACSSSWLQLAPPPEVMELVEKKKLTEQFKTVEGLIDRADYLGALRLQADRRNVLHFLALDEQEMQTYLWQPRFPRIVDLSSQSAAAAGPPPRPADQLIDPKQLWLRFLTIAPPLYSTATPLAAGGRSKKGGGADGLRVDASSRVSPPPNGIQEYCLSDAGEQFLPLLFDDFGGADECLPPEELLQFEEDALRELASHVEAKLTHALSCMLFAAKSRTRTSALKRRRSRQPAAAPQQADSAPEAADGGVAEAAYITSGSEADSRVKRLKMKEEHSGISTCPETPGKEGPEQNGSGSAEAFNSNSPLASLSSSPPPISESVADTWGVPAALTQRGSDGRGVSVDIEDLVATYGAAPRLMRHEHCFQEDSDCRHVTV